VETGDEQRGRIIFRQVFGPVRPAQRGEWPEAGAEPGIENIRVLLQAFGAAARTSRRGFASHDDFPALAAVPGWDAMAPPELARNAPVADVIHPLVVGLHPVSRNKFNLAALHHLDRFFGQRLGFY